MENMIRQITEEIKEDLREIRRTIHRHPETAFQEYRTHDYVCECLEKIEGLTIQRNAARGTGIIATMEGLAGPGKTILLRGDMDALPIQEQTECDYRSEEAGCMHACGHDAHTAWLIGAAMILSRTRHLWKGTVKFMFQPAEEIGAGARIMIEEDHILENPKVDMAFAAHVWPKVQSGKIGIPVRYAFGAPGDFKVKIYGKSGHGATPEQAIDPLAIANEFYARIPAILARKMKGTDSKLVTVTYMLAGERDVLNIIPATCEMGGTMRTISLELMREMGRLMEEELRSICEVNGATYEIWFRHDLDSVKNCHDLLEPVRGAAAEILGEENVVLIEEDNLVGEDFSEISTKIPSVFLMAGINEGNNVCALHNAKFGFDDEILANVSAVFAKMVIKFC